MPTLSLTLGCGNAETLSAQLKTQLEALPINDLALHQATTQGGAIADKPISISILNITESNTTIQVRAGMFFTEVVGGCNCHDDPVEYNGYGITQITIDRQTGNADIQLLTDDEAS